MDRWASIGHATLSSASQGSVYKVSCQTCNFPRCEEPTSSKATALLDPQPLRNSLLWSSRVQVTAQSFQHIPLERGQLWCLSASIKSIYHMLGLVNVFWMMHCMGTWTHTCLVPVSKEFVTFFSVSRLLFYLVRMCMCLDPHSPPHPCAFKYSASNRAELQRAFSKLLFTLGSALPKQKLEDNKTRAVV